MFGEHRCFFLYRPGSTWARYSRILSGVIMRKILGLIVLVTQCASSYAALGGAPSKFTSTQSAVKARSVAAASSTAATSSSTASTTTTYNVSESTLASGTVVREYATSAGVVFAVSWTGPQMPDLRTLLGDHFATMTDAAAKKPKAGHSQLRVANSDVVIVSGGHMRAYTGRAWLPAQLPAGFTAANIE
jgi:hypothetical protein